MPVLTDLRELVADCFGKRRGFVDTLRTGFGLEDYKHA